MSPMECASIPASDIDLFEEHERLFVCGSSSSGKSTFTIDLIKKYAHKFDIIVICGVHSHPLKQDSVIAPKIYLSPTIVDPLEFKTREDEKILFILDDLYAEVAESSMVRNIFTRGRHLNISVINITQNLFYKGKFFRDISLNVTCFVLMKQRDLGQIEILGRQIFGGKRSKEFVEIYQMALRERDFGYLCVDIGPRTPESLTLRTNIVGEKPFEIVYKWS